MSKTKEYLLTPQIVKIQQAFIQSENKVRVMIYNEDRSFNLQTGSTNVVNKVKSFLQDKKKGYALAQVSTSDINILESIENLKW